MAVLSRTAKLSLRRSCCQARTTAHAQLGDDFCIYFRLPFVAQERALLKFSIMSSRHTLLPFNSFFWACSNCFFRCASVFFTFMSFLRSLKNWADPMFRYLWMTSQNIESIISSGMCFVSELANKFLHNSCRLEFPQIVVFESSIRLSLSCWSRWELRRLTRCCSSSRKKA